MSDHIETDAGQGASADGSPESEPSTRHSAQERRIEELSRALADLRNDQDAFRQRLVRERDRQRELDRHEAAGALIDALGELWRALSADGGASPLAQGVRLIADELERRLAAMGITRIPALGERFDPAFHEAIEVVPVPDEARDGQVVGEVSAGFRAGTRVVRPARVQVGRHAPVAGEQAPG